MTHSLRMGASFGLTSGIITTLGLIMGLSFGTGSKLAVIGGILAIAVADSFSDALGMHASLEAEEDTQTKDIWLTTFATFFSKFLFSSTFLIPMLIFSLKVATFVSAFYGLAVLTIFSFVLAKERKSSTLAVIIEHLLVAVAVIGATGYLGKWISKTFEY